MSIPYFPLYPADFEADTSHLTMEEDGAYNRLLRLLWMAPGCTLPDDPAWLARRMRCDAATYDRVVMPIIDEFFSRRDGRVFSPRLMQEFKKADVTSRKRSDAGKKGGRPKVSENKEKTQKAGFDFDKGGLSDTRALPEPEPDISYSVTDVTDSGAVEEDFAKQVFDRAVAFLGHSGIVERQARAFVGRLRKTSRDKDIFDAFVACGKAGAVDPIPWITARLSRPKTDLDAAFSQFLGGAQ